MEMMIIEPRVGRLGKTDDAGANPIRDSVGGRPSAIAMDEGGHAPSPDRRAQAADLADETPTS